MENYFKEDYIQLLIENLSKRTKDASEDIKKRFAKARKEFEIFTNEITKGCDLKQEKNGIGM